MRKRVRMFLPALFLLPFFLAVPKASRARSPLDCTLCHATENNQWLLSRHADTQADVADELSLEWTGLPPDSVILGPNAEDCVACHGPASIHANGGMSEVETMGYFFSTTGGVYTDSTHVLHPDEWAHNGCVTCHDVPGDHPVSMPGLAIFDSPSAEYHAVSNASELCGQCHGTLRFPDTDHRRMDAWLASKHGHGGQDDVGSELAAEWAGHTPQEVIDEEDCIACHASTSVRIDGGLSEAEALALFFTTTGGNFTDSTALQNRDAWPEVSCTACHDQHNPGEPAYFNSESRSYEVEPSSQELCGQCHGDLRFPDTDHLSYNIEQGTGGQGVPDQVTMPGARCVDCHMHVGEIDDTNALMYGGHSWSVFVQEADQTVTASCTVCHASMDADSAAVAIAAWQDEYANLNSIATFEVQVADSLLSGSSDSTLIHLLQDAQFNLAFAQGDESGGAHNHSYTKALLNNAIDNAEIIIGGGVGIGGDSPDDFVPIVKAYALAQNFPNPFNPATTIRYDLPEASRVRLNVFDVTGRLVRTLVDGEQPAGSRSIEWNGRDESGRNVGSGVYLYRLQAGDYLKVRKMLLLK